MFHPAQQQDSSQDSASETDTQHSNEKDPSLNCSLTQEESGCCSETRTESSSSLSSSSSCSSCSNEEKKVEMECVAPDCHKTSYKSRKYLPLPWKCKYHRNKAYKETYKKRKALNNKSALNMELLLHGTESQSDGQGGTPRQKPAQQRNMLEQVLNEKKMALMQSPVVLEFLQKQQQKKHNQHRHQQKPWSVQEHQRYGPTNQR
ncbi:uncharacterized protein [Asterias amurensis]|uniref:uncharacterized protein n=1 Tax=Asterias amurensis TaxID=7602 RepID=UPI003AB8FA10